MITVSSALANGYVRAIAFSGLTRCFATSETGVPEGEAVDDIHCMVNYGRAMADKCRCFMIDSNGHAFGKPQSLLLCNANTAANTCEITEREKIAVAAPTAVIIDQDRMDNAQITMYSARGKKCHVQVGGEIEINPYLPDEKYFYGRYTVSGPQTGDYCADGTYIRFEQEIIPALKGNSIVQFFRQIF